MATSRTGSGLSRTQSTFVHANATEVAQLPAPDEDPWLASEEDIDHTTAVRLSEAEIIEVVEVVSLPTPDGTNTNWKRRWRTKPAPYEAACDRAADLDTLPCCPDGTGISTRAAPEGSYFDEKWYACRACGTAHTREIAAEVLR